MTIKVHQCITVACDVCGYEYDQDEYTAHFSDFSEARTVLSGNGWTTTADRKVLCMAVDDQHQAFMDALLPPEPVTQVPGQLGLDGSEA